MRAAMLIVAWMCSRAIASPEPDPSPQLPDPGGASSPPAAAPTPQPAGDAPQRALPDLSPSRLPDPPEPSQGHPVASAVALGGVYAGFSAWAYLAWYVKHKPLGYFKWGGDGWLGDTTYAGGADKLGHAWATMGLARIGTALLSSYGGYDHLASSLVSAGLAEALFFFVEVKDGFFYEFSFSDFTGDTAGMALALLLDNVPRLDEMFDYRVEYFPSRAYRDNVSGGSGFSRLNIAEDYSGETYLLAYHLGSIHALAEQPWGTWSRFVDLTLGFDTRGYKPSPPAGEPSSAHHQDVFLGVSLNAQGLFDWLLEDHPSQRARTTRKITHAVFEMFNLPFTSHEVLQHSHSPTGQVMTGGA
jgi:hypothetical protein